ncbi:MAG: hypothetical protein CMG75_09805 [Candidatus Marinimicrobia bacterium]|nr:hypothetical protein [Candidatus Neomarinimicrobiota bacterium]|tara:strand:- start:12560 stop:15367 length:2808 start_codon:yes stop_codon:yes gene_type:complete
MKNRTITFFVFFLFYYSCLATSSITKYPQVEKSLSDLTIEEKVGQMFMVRYTGGFYREDDHTFKNVKRLIADYHIGGIVSYFGSVYGTIENLNEIQSFSKIPLIVAADYERGVGQHLEGATLFPTNMAMAATGNTQLSYEQGRITAIEARSVGVHVAFAPVMDVNSNSNNPIINFRSYGDTPEIVSQYGNAFIRGAQDHGLIACIKHFPGHGNTSVDSHTTLPIIESEKNKFRSIDLPPFKDAIDAGVKMVMTAHISIPAIDDSKLPATLSNKISKKILRDDFGFKGIIVTDAMEMGGITETFWSSEAAVRTIEAGSDIVLLPLDNDTAIKGVLNAVKSGRISIKRIDQSVQKILHAKQELGLWDEREVPLSKARRILGNGNNTSIATEAARKSITLINDDLKTIPISPTNNNRMTHILLATDEGMLSYSKPFRSAVSRLHGNVKSEFYYQELSHNQISDIIAKADSSDHILISLLIRVRMNIGRVTIDPSHRELIEKFHAIKEKVTIVSFGSPYVSGVDSLGTYLAAYGYGSISMNAMANALFGSAPITGKLPVSLSPKYPQGHGIKKEVDLWGRELSEILDFTEPESILNNAIADSIFPGVSTLVLYGGEVIWSKQIGRQAYSSLSPLVNAETIYDLASLTKVVATTSIVMKLSAQNKLPLDEPVKDFIPQFTGGGKDLVTIRHLLTHSAGLKPFKKYPLGLSANEIISDIINEPLIHPPGMVYEYSDFGMILLGKICEIISGEKFDVLSSKLIFKPLGMKNTFFIPDSSIIFKVAPTEIDNIYNRGLVQGIVHDERAWQLGGIAGHAGLFSSAKDLGVFSQMMMDYGFFGGRRYFSRSIIEKFTSKQELPKGSDRAIGWDTPTKGKSSAGQYFSAGSFGHTGFTGTSIWIDPNRRIAIILLTNRVHPTRKRGGITKVRQEFHNAVMKVLLNR